jgi:hypothetical protein
MESTFALWVRQRPVVAQAADVRPEPGSRGGGAARRIAPTRRRLPSAADPTVRGRAQVRAQARKQQPGGRRLRWERWERWER